MRKPSFRNKAGCRAQNRLGFRSKNLEPVHGSIVAFPCRSPMLTSITMDLVVEANSQLIAAWRVFCKSFPKRDLGDLPGLKLAWGEVPYFGYNAIVLSEPAASQEELDQRSARAIEYMRAQRFSGIFIVCNDWLPAGARFPDGLRVAWKMTGMVTDQLLPPVRSFPKLDIRRASDQQTLIDLHDVNSAGYGIDPELARASIGPVEDWEQNAFGYVGYQDGKPVSCAATLVVDSRLYVAFVATMPNAQRRGYAEAVMRHSLNEAAKASGLQRTILHASDEGFPIYYRMGYRPTSKFTVYMRA